MASNAAFVGSVPENYHRYLGPLLFEPYARDMAGRLRVPAGGRALETACGTGIVTRDALEAMPEGAALTATDLNEAMVEVARKYVSATGTGNAAEEKHKAQSSKHKGDGGTGAEEKYKVQSAKYKGGQEGEARVSFRVADAQALPFADGSFDVVFCQFGVMFFPDKVRAMREARRVLAPKGRFVFNVWDSLERNPMSATVHETVGRLFPSNPPDFLKKTPFGWNDRGEIERVLRAGGFGEISMDAVTFPSVAPTAEDGARGLLEGTPLFAQLQERGVSDFGPIRKAVAEALGAKHGQRPCRAEMRALVFSVGR